jgi:hypothetical protein
VIIFDRECAMFSVPDHPQAAALVRDPLVVAFILEAYERMWLAADPYPVGDDVHGELDGELKQAIIRHLITGMTDAAVARRLGMSVRTCRRHVAEIMAALGAESRLQMGYLLGAKPPSS